MPDFFIVRLGKDSVDEIRLLDALHESPSSPVTIKIQCSQVPKDFVSGKFVFICFGSDNNKGMAVDWVRGLRAFGLLEDRTGGSAYSDLQTLTIRATVILVRSVTPKDFLANAPAAYFWFSDVPIIGVDTHSQQTVQRIDSTSQNQSVSALFYALQLIQPGFKAQVLKAHPELSPLFDYSPPSPGVGSEQKLADSGTRDESVPNTFPAEWILALAARGFLLVTGSSGTGKTRTARDLARAFDYALEPRYAATISATRPSTSLAFIPVAADWTDSTPLLGFRNFFGAPRTIADSDGGKIVTNEAWVPAPALLVILRAIARPDHPHFLVLDEMNLSHVERYFSDFLSVMEGNRGLPANDKIPILDAETVALIATSLQVVGAHPFEAEVAATLSSKGSTLTVPDNLFVIGTVNVDETTYMFSPKVLDRAHVLELSVPDTLRYLAGELSTESAISLEEAQKVLVDSALRRRNGFWEREHPMEVLKAAMNGKLASEETAKVVATLNTVLAGLQKLLQPVGFGFGFRTVKEVIAYVSTYFELNNKILFESTEFGWVGAIDRALIQKVLPKIHGSRRQLATSLRAVSQFLDGDIAAFTIGRESFKIDEANRLRVPLPLSRAKVNSMNSRLEATGHTTFIT